MSCPKTLHVFKNKKNTYASNWKSNQKVNTADAIDLRIQNRDTRFIEVLLYKEPLQYGLVMLNT